MNVRVLAGFAVLVAVVALALGLKGCGDDNKPHKALCWDPSYAKTHTLHNAKTFANLGKELPLGSRHCRS